MRMEMKIGVEMGVVRVWECTREGRRRVNNMQVVGIRGHGTGSSWVRYWFDVASGTCKIDFDAPFQVHTTKYIYKAAWQQGCSYSRAERSTYVIQIHTHTTQYIPERIGRSIAPLPLFPWSCSGSGQGQGHTRAGQACHALSLYTQHMTM
jgi:hypothetical protein